MIKEEHIGENPMMGEQEKNTHLVNNIMGHVIHILHTISIYFLGRLTFYIVWFNLGLLHYELKIVAHNLDFR
jgi:hypothetical protein